MYVNALNSVAYVNRLTIPQLDNALNIVGNEMQDLKNKLSTEPENVDPKLVEKLSLMQAKFLKAKTKINRYYEKTVKKNPGMVISRNKLTVLDTIKNPAKRAAEKAKDIRSPYGGFNAWDAIEDKRGFLIAGVATAGTLGVMASIKTTLSKDALDFLGLAGDKVFANNVTLPDGTAATQFNLLEIVGAFLKMHPEVVIALGATAAIVFLANMPKIRAAWNRGKLRKAEYLKTENKIYDEADKLNPDRKLLNDIIAHKNDLSAIPNLAQELGDHPDLVARLSMVLSNTNDKSLPNSVKDSLLKFMYSNGLGKGLPAKDTYDPKKAIIASKFAGIELSIVENEATAYAEAKKINEDNMTSSEYTYVVALYNKNKTNRIEELCELLSDPSKCPPTINVVVNGTPTTAPNPAHIRLTKLAKELENKTKTSRTTALGNDVTIGTNTKPVSDFFSDFSIDALIGNPNTTVSSEAITLRDAKRDLDLGRNVEISTIAITSPSPFDSTLKNYKQTLIEYRNELAKTNHFTDAENKIEEAVNDSLGFTGLEKTEAAALKAIEVRLGIKDPAAQQTKLKEMVQTIEATRTMGA